MMLIAAFCSQREVAYDASGVSQATEVTVSAMGNGKIINLATNEGDRGNAGDTPGLLDTTQLYLNKLQLEASIRAVSGSL